MDVTSSTGDAHAAFVKAAALGIADTPDAPLVVLPGIAQAGHFQDLMLANDVVRYAELSQRFAARNAAPNKNDGDAEPPLGYRLSRRTRMSLDVYNFTGASRTVTVRALPARGWAARAEGPTRFEIPTQGRTTLDFTITADGGVKRRTDHRLEFTATLVDGTAVPPSVSAVQLT
ncbi:hypothetical protein ACF1HJ_30010 [Streptomyces sp. NPDC013978]|uniref:hypothetical protein n=1 Tax=Streptomyces sp. NPDC013978 TaxID=3364869 RepID=UPI0036FEBBA7